SPELRGCPTPRVPACGWSPRLPAAPGVRVRPIGPPRGRQRYLVPNATDSAILRRAVGDAAIHRAPEAIGRAETATVSCWPQALPETPCLPRHLRPTALARIALPSGSTMTG